MGQRFKQWNPRTKESPKNFQELAAIVRQNRGFSHIDQLKYGDYGLDSAFKTILASIRSNKRIALYADYDVDGTMSCISWIWFFQSINFDNFIYYIPDRFQEGYGVNLDAVKHLVLEKKADTIITMDTGITANQEAQWCKDHGVQFICTDHHKIQASKMPDCIILNPKLHPDPLYQELCGCGITFVLLRKLGEVLNPPSHVWTDILALTGMATICDVVPLNGVNHKLAQLGVQALLRSKRKVFKDLLKAASINNRYMDERDVGFRLGPRINAVGRLEHAKQVISAFVDNDSDSLIHHMGICNERRKSIQNGIVAEARELARKSQDLPILFLGGDWHQGVVGIAASKIAEEFWKPVLLYHKTADLCKGSARSIPHVDIMDGISVAGEFFKKFGGHSAAAGFSFDAANEDKIRETLTGYGKQLQKTRPSLWESSIEYDCFLPESLLNLSLTSCLDEMRPFGHCFEEPLFLIEAPILQSHFYKDKKTGEDRHTAVEISYQNERYKIMFFNEVYRDFPQAKKAKFLVNASRNVWNGKTSLSLTGCDYTLH